MSKIYNKNDLLEMSDEEIKKIYEDLRLEYDRAGMIKQILYMEKFIESVHSTT
jgi:hypothetical protein